MSRYENKYWVDPNGRAFDHLTNYQNPAQSFGSLKALPSGDTHTTDAEAVLMIDNPEIISPRSPVESLPIHPPQMPDLPRIPSLQELVRETVEAIDITRPEGILDELFGRLGHRLNKKTQYGNQLAELRHVLVKNLEQIRMIAVEASAIERVRYQVVIDAISAERQRLENLIQIQTLKIKFAEQAHIAQRVRYIDDAKAAAEIAKYEAETAQYKAQIAETERRALNAKNPPLLPAPAEEAARMREEAQLKRKIRYDMQLDALDAEADYDDGKMDRGLQRILEIWANPHNDRYTMRRRIEKAIEKFNVDENSLPRGIQELLTEEETIDE